MISHEFKEKQDQAAHSFVTQRVSAEKEGQIKQRLQTGAFSYEQDFILNQTRSQQAFYGDYERKWGQKNQGQLVDRPDMMPVAERQVQERKLGYFEKIRRRKTAERSATAWETRLRILHDPMGRAMRAERGEDGEIKLVPNPTMYGLKLNRDHSHNSDTYDIMNRTIKLGAIENKRRELFKQVIGEKAKQNPLFAKYQKEIIALGPPLIPDENDDLTSRVTMTQQSLSAFTHYLQRIAADPVGAIKEADRKSVV